MSHQIHIRLHDLRIPKNVLKMRGYFFIVTVFRLGGKDGCPTKFPSLCLGPVGQMRGGELAYRFRRIIDCSEI